VDVSFGEVEGRGGRRETNLRSYGKRAEFNGFG
jgi:hypothetical protein